MIYLKKFNENKSELIKVLNNGEYNLLFKKRIGVSKKTRDFLNTNLQNIKNGNHTIIINYSDTTKYGVKCIVYYHNFLRNPRNLIMYEIGELEDEYFLITRYDYEIAIDGSSRLSLADGYDGLEEFIKMIKEWIMSLKIWEN